VPAGINTKYTLRSAMLSMQEREWPNWSLHDLSYVPDELEIKALVASDDYLELLASNIDKIVHMQTTSDPMQVELEQLVRTLLYLHQHYKLVPRAS